MIAVRPATVADIPAIRAVASVTWHATYAGLIAAPDIELFLERAYSASHVARTLDRLGDGYLVATDGDRVVGYAMTGPDREGAAELWAMYVIPDFQGRGIGHALWERATAYLWAGGYVEFALWVAAGNTSARRFYERHGAVAVGERVDDIGDSRVVEIRYQVRLHSPSDRARPH